MGSVRWAFRCGSWTPSRSDWLFAARCVQREEKDRIGQFVFAKDAKSAMAGRLLLRKFVCERMGIPWSQIRLERSLRGKPYLVAPLQVTTSSDPSWSFNLSHQGDYAVLAAQQELQVGVDVMKTTMPVPQVFHKVSLLSNKRMHWPSSLKLRSRQQLRPGVFPHHDSSVYCARVEHYPISRLGAPAACRVLPPLDPEGELHQGHRHRSGFQPAEGGVSPVTRTAHTGLGAVPDQDAS
ncbi:hypothetical protein GOODEAATRI_009097 [Goodea atripinnis]|uniref:holo-[acyl-carrier-protein] synthase n=1 Tax=Goodea atripinnis TaxID=208336 RepID=A0ABV0NT16_9TELE